MKIAFISTILGFPWGSPDRLWTDLAQRCLVRGDTVFLGISALTAQHAAVEDLRNNGATIFIRSQNSIFQGTRDALSRRLPWNRGRYLENHLARFKPDFVFITQGATYDSLAEHHLVSWLRDTAIPHFVICHCNREDAQPVESDISRVRRYFEAASRVLFVSTHNLHLAERQLGATLRNASVVQNPLATLIPAAAPFPVRDTVPVVGTLGRLDAHHKGLDLLLEAMGGLPPGTLRLIITGSGPDNNYLLDLVRHHKLEGWVEVREPVPAHEVPRALEELELFLLTSRYEGCASSMLEAMMCGRPVLATNVGGVGDWIKDGVEGFIATDCTAACIRETLTRALAARTSWPAMGNSARNRFDRQRDPDPANAVLKLIDTEASPKKT